MTHAEMPSLYLGLYSVEYWDVLLLSKGDKIRDKTTVCVNVVSGRKFGGFQTTTKLFFRIGQNVTGNSLWFFDRNAMTQFSRSVGAKVQLFRQQ